MNEILTGLTGMTGGLGVLIMVVAGLAFILYLVPIPLWIAAWASGAYVGLFTLIGMRRCPRRWRRRLLSPQRRRRLGYPAWPPAFPVAALRPAPRRRDGVFPGAR